MRKLMFRFLLIGIFVLFLLKLNDEPQKNYGTTVASAVGDVKIDVPYLITTISIKLDERRTEVLEWSEKCLKEFGFTPDVCEND